MLSLAALSLKHAIRLQLLWWGAGMKIEKRNEEDIPPEGVV